MDFLKVFAPMLLMVIVILLLYNVLKVYVLENIKVNKWIVLVIAALIFALPNIILKGGVTGIWRYIQTGLFLIFFLWFMDLTGLNGMGARKKKEDTRNQVIKSKAKPNRIKDGDIEVIDNKKKKKK